MYLTGSYFKALHKMPLTKIGRSHVSSAVNKITGESGAAAAGRARAHLSAFFTWCLQQGHCGDRDNPVVDSANPKAGPPRDRVLKDGELAAIWAACGDDDYGKIIRLLILTGCRREEIGGLRWSEIDLDAGMLKLPGERTKNHHAHELPLVPAALDIIRLIPQRVGRDHLFGDRSPHGFSKWGQGKAAFRDGIVEPWRPHDLRRTLTTGMCELGIEPHIVEAITNHRSGHKSGIAGTYNYARYKPQMKTALNVWADHVRSLVEENERKVVSINSLRD
jgi:integrase